MAQSGAAVLANNKEVWLVLCLVLLILVKEGLRKVPQANVPLFWKKDWGHGKGKNVTVSLVKLEAG